MKNAGVLLSAGFLMGSASVSYGADDVIAPEPVEYVRVCDAYGAGYFYIPGTETCLRIHGHVRSEITGGDNVSTRKKSSRDRDSYSMMGRLSLRVSTATETELGTLETFTETRFQFADGKNSGSNGTLRFGYIQLGGLRVGLDESAFHLFPGKYGSVLNDKAVLGSGTRGLLMSYTYKADNGFSAVLSLEQGGDDESDVDVTIDGYMPHVVGGLKYQQDWGKLTGVVGYDARNEEWAAKLRGDLNVTDAFSVWLMGAYKTNDDHYATQSNGDSYRMVDSFYGTWGGDWAVWGGAAYKASKKATFNLQLSYETAKTYAATANVAYQAVKGLTITPEISYTKWDDRKSSLNGYDAWEGKVRIQRAF